MPHARTIPLMVGFVLLGTGGLAAVAQTEEDVLIPTNRVQSDTLGYHVSFDGATILGGAPFGTLGGVTQAGRAFVWELQGGAWQQTQTLRPSRIQAFGFFGIESAVHGNTMMVSGLGEDNRAGAAYVFEKSGGTWTQTARLVPRNRLSIDLFGGGMSMRDDVLVIGSVGRATPSGSETGASFIFEPVAGTWTQTAMLYPAVGTPFGNFGIDSAIVGNTVVIGALSDDNQGVNRAGAVHVFELTGGGGWTEIVKLTPADPVERGELGTSVALNAAATTIVAGAPGASAGGEADAGAVYVFDLDNGQWTPTVKLTAPDATFGDSFGQAVVIDGDTILVGAFLDDNSNGAGAGAAYVFRRNAGVWEFDTKIVASTAGNLTYGWALDMHGDRAVIGAPFHSLNRGALYVYTGLSAVCIPGDLNGDDVVDLADLGILLADFGCTGGACAGDIDGDGDTDLADLGILLANFGQSCP